MHTRRRSLRRRTFPSSSRYAAERNGDALDSNAWTTQGTYELSDVTWKPTFTYRYAFFQGDDPATAADEAFDPLFPGFYDWGYWWQGEIAGEYFLSNSNLASHLVRAHFTPAESVSGGLLFYRFRLDQPGIGTGRRSPRRTWPSRPTSTRTGK